MNLLKHLRKGEKRERPQLLPGVLLPDLSRSRLATPRLRRDVKRVRSSTFRQPMINILQLLGFAPTAASFRTRCYPVNYQRW